MTRRELIAEIAREQGVSEPALCIGFAAFETRYPGWLDKEIPPEELETERKRQSEISLAMKKAAFEMFNKPFN